MLTFVRNVLLMVVCLLSAPVMAESMSTSRIDDIPASVDIDGVAVTLQVVIWKDMMPRVSVPGVIVRKPGYQMRVTLNAGASRMSPDPAKTRAQVRPERIWVIRGKDIWEGNFSQAERTGIEEYAIRNGPPWPVGGTVDVVVRFVDSNRKAHAVKAVGVGVEAAH